MAYRLKRGETVPEGIRRIVDEEGQSALEHLKNGKGSKRGEAIHEARKSLKKIRGALRLVQPELGAVYGEENTRIGNIGRQLSEIRDATAVIEVFDALRAKFNGTLQRGAFASIRHGLEQNRREAEQSAVTGRVVQRATTALHAIRRRAGKWPLKSDGFKAIAPGLELRYRRGRKAMALAEKDPSPENYHEWRKRVKDHWYHLRLLESLWTDIMQVHESSLDDLQNWLGDDHNLIVLNAKLGDQADRYGKPEDIQMFLALANQYQRELRERALSLGQRVYERKPAQLIRDFSKLWDAWQEQPDSMRDVQRAQRQAVKKQPARAPQVARKAAVA